MQAAAGGAFAQAGELGADRADGEMRGAAGYPGNDRDQPVGRMPARRGGEQGRVRQPLALAQAADLTQHGVELQALVVGCFSGALLGIGSSGSNAGPWRGRDAGVYRCGTSRART